MSISSGTLNLRFMQRGTPLPKPASPAPQNVKAATKASTTTTTNSTTDPAESPSTENLEWSLSESTLAKLKAAVATSSSSSSGPRKPSVGGSKSRVTYESSYMPFLEDSIGNAQGEGSSRTAEGRLSFGQPATKRKKVSFQVFHLWQGVCAQLTPLVSSSQSRGGNGDEEDDSQQRPTKPKSDGRMNPTSSERWSRMGQKFDPDASSTGERDNHSSRRDKNGQDEQDENGQGSRRRDKKDAKSTPDGFLRPAGFEESSPATTTSKPKSKKKRKSRQGANGQPQQGQQHQEHDSDSSDADTSIIHGARKKQKKTTRHGRQ